MLFKSDSLDDTNYPPEFTIYPSDTAINTYEHLSVSLDALDIDGDSIVYSITNGPDAEIIGDSLFDWTPESSDTGIWDVTLSACGAEEWAWLCDTCNFNITVYSTSIEETQSQTEAFAMGAYPNPFNSSVRITVEGGETAKIEIYDMNGRRVEPVTELVEMPGGSELPSTSSGSGSCTYIWKPDPSLPSGMYFVKVSFANELVKKPIVYLK